MPDYDLIVLGSGPAGEKGAAQAAYYGKRVVIVERASHVGGAAINTGTILPRPSARRRCTSRGCASAACMGSTTRCAKG